ncbi:hemerythrin domain-containing protein [Noviherbaspirillum sp.]|uniref:hemerythrin domain-containing protein n=1 Tax=Noviherbaspirillum sp. TaxID=1926288 RepID=UPI002D44DABE|nr:hemerythrin domain-containing protein [Noviherbaspirillum sp.]HZW21453.1 hemerythrin domain-containing protein [Noviherbaspirillum sp.]
MNIEKFKHQHVKIFECIETLRLHSLAGVAANAREIALTVVRMSSVIKLHLSVEDTVLYPALRSSSSRAIAKMGDAYQDEMKVIARSYEEFARKWNTASNVARDPDGFRADANVVLKKLYARIRQEDADFYPAIEAI